jgi:patched 2 protein
LFWFAGIDDVFVLVNILRNFLEDPTLQALSAPGDFVPEREMRLTVALAGPSVVLTTFSVLAAFFISSLVYSLLDTTLLLIHV